MLRAVVISLLIPLFPVVCLSEGTVEKGPAPEWVVRSHFPYQSDGKDGEADGAEQYLLLDLQKHAEKKSTYEELAIRVLTEAGVEDHSQLSVDFQPSFQSVVWHHLDVIRGGEKQDRLADAEFELIRREEGLESRLYDGAITAHLILKDIRPGDIISYSFTTKGENPVLAGHVHGKWSMGYSVPTDRIRRALIWNPDVRTMAWRLNGLEAKAHEEELQGGLRRISYDLEKPAKIVAEKNTPQWFRDYPDLEFSDYASWADFGKWTAAIYITDAPLPKELKEVCEKIRKEGGTPHERAIKALRWSQGNIRYLGSFFGEHTLAPYTLEEICTRRFGDCKDKGILTVAMLRELGFDASPALVNTYLQAAVADMLPGHAFFDHLIVHLRLEGKEYWLDPTRTFQRGSLDSLYSPDYGYAFVIREGASELTSVRPSGFAEVGINVHETINIVDNAGNGTLVVRTVASGVNADNLRRTLADDGRAELEKDFREYYADDFPGLEINAPLVVEDDTEANRITTVESYRLKDYFSLPGSPGGHASGSVYARDISGYLNAPDSRERKHPYRISHPVRRSQTIEFTTTKNWSMEAEEFSASLPAAEYRYRARPEGRTLVLSHEYESRSAHVEPGDFVAYTKAMKEATDKLHFEFNYPLDNKPTDSAETLAAKEKSYTKSRGLLGAFVIFGMIIGLIASIAIHFWDPPARASTMPNPRSLGGWLILPTIGCFVIPVASIIIIGSSFSNIGEDNVNLFSGAADEDMWRIYYCTTVFMEGILFSLGMLQIILLLKKRTSFPYFFIGYTVAAFASLLLAHALQSTVDAADNDAEFAGEIAGNVIKMGIWCTICSSPNGYVPPS